MRRRRDNRREETRRGAQAVGVAPPSPRAQQMQPISKPAARVVRGVESKLAKMPNPVKAAGGRTVTLKSAGVPQAVLDAPANKRVTNDSRTLNQVNLIKAVVRDLDERGQVRDEVRNKNPVSANMTSRDRETVQRLGVTSPTSDAGTGKRANHACLAAHRPSVTSGDGGGRPFVHWCKKGKT